MSTEHVVPVGLYYRVFGLLLALTALTTGIAFIDLGRMNTIAALAIAVVKAVVVVLFFMHVKYSRQLTRLVLISALFWFGLLLALTMTDYLTRGWQM
jgi:cytochrome c oxidase subunit 4